MNDRIRISDEKINGSIAAVVVSITHYYNSGPFGGSSEWTSDQTFDLRQEGGAWRITDLPYDYIP